MNLGTSTTASQVSKRRRDSIRSCCCEHPIQRTQHVHPPTASARCRAPRSDPIHSRAMGAETDLPLPPLPEPAMSPEPEILGHDDHRNWKADMLSALGESVSFGRFLSEPLEWGKWSAFEHKRHLEEAAHQSRPGSVAQKKAFFEAHYARKRKSEADAEDAGGCDLDLDRPDDADWSADSSCMTGEPVSEETHTQASGVGSDAADCGGGVVDSAPPVEAPGELKAITDGVDSSCRLEDTDERPRKQDDVPVAEAAKGDMAAVVDAVQMQPLKESSIVNQGVTDSGKKRRFQMSSLVQKPTKSSSPPSVKKAPSSAAKRRSPLHPAKENSSPTPSTDSGNQAAASVSMNFMRCETGNAASSSRNLGSTVAARISQLESASMPFEDANPKVNQFRPAKKAFCKGMPEVVPRTSELEEQRSSHVSVTRVKEKLFGSTSPSVHQKTNVTKEKLGKANSEAEMKELRQGFCFNVRPLPNFHRRNKEAKDSSQQSAQDNSNLRSYGHPMNKGTTKDKQMCCFPLRRLC